MKLVIYYLLILTPLILIFYLLRSDFNYKIFIVAMLVYIFIYRNLIDSARLKDLGLIDKITLNPIQGFTNRIKFFKELYFRV